MGTDKKAAQERIDSASRVILASPRTLFRAFVDPEMLASWRASDGMAARIERFDPRIGGGYRITLSDAAEAEDVADVRFLDLGEDRIVEQIKFASSAPEFAGPMTMSTSFEPVVDGTKVTIAARGVPARVSPDDHQAILASSLRNLARLTE